MLIITYNKFYRGDIYLADLSPCIGSEQNGIRPVLIIQNNIGNKFSPTVIIAPVTSRYNAKSKLPTHVLLPVDLGLGQGSMALLEQIRVIDKSRLSLYICSLNENIMKEINQAILISLEVN